MIQIKKNKEAKMAAMLLTIENARIHYKPSHTAHVASVICCYMHIAYLVIHFSFHVNLHVHKQRLPIHCFLCKVI